MRTIRKSRAVFVYLLRRKFFCDCSPAFSLTFLLSRYISGFITYKLKVIPAQQKFFQHSAANGMAIIFDHLREYFGLSYENNHA